MNLTGSSGTVCDVMGLQKCMAEVEYAEGADLHDNCAYGYYNTSIIKMFSLSGLRDEIDVFSWCIKLLYLSLRKFLLALILISCDLIGLIGYRSFLYHWEGPQ